MLDDQKMPVEETDTPAEAPAEQPAQPAEETPEMAQ
jgi:hypothetical protein